MISFIEDYVQDGDIEEFEDRNCIKVVCDLNNDALYFSREPIPTRKFLEMSQWRNKFV